MEGKYQIKYGWILLLLLFLFHGSLISQTGWYPLQSGTSNILKSVYFVNNTTGYMSGEGIILKTFNSGNNWFVINDNIGGTSLQFIDINTGYVCDGTIFKTTNGGINWIDLQLTSLNSLYFLNNNTGFAVGKNNQIIKTTNGGTSWKILSSGGFLNEFNSVCFINDNVGFIAGGKSFLPYFGVVYKTTNGGDNWNVVLNDVNEVDFRGIDFVNSTTGYLVGGNEYESNGVIYKTTNSGETWVQQGIVNKDLNAVCFANPLTGYAVGEDGMILKTSDGSVVWNTQISSTTEDINSIYFVADNVGFTAGNSGLAQKTTNGGVFGPPFGISGRVTFIGGTFVNKGIVKALKYDAIADRIVVIDQANIQPDGTFILTNIPKDSLDIMVYPNDEDEDSPMPPKFVPCYYTGNTNAPTINWTSSKTLYPVNNLFNVNISVYPITGTGGSRIIGGGVYNSPPNVSPLSGSIVYAMIGNEFKGYSVSRNGGVYDVNNLVSGNYHMICDRIGYRNAEKDVVLGSVNLDTINFYMIGINVIGIQPNGTAIPEVFRLEQNYPNPFNPVTTIKVDIPKSGSVRLAVYDMLGKELEVLVNENLNAGSYKVMWNASKYSSGIYFYKIYSSDFADTKKMILVK